MISNLTLEGFFNDAFKDIEDKIKQIVSDEQILSILDGGKRLRPLLATLVYKTCTNNKDTMEQYQRFLEGAVSVELAHNASLVHDDIIDGDLKRRGKPAFYIQAGIGNAILIGHKMLAIGFNIALSHGDKTAKLYVDTWNKTLTGQLTEINFNSKDLGNLSKNNISADSKFFQLYSTIIDLKTASLFSSACKAAAFAANADDQLSEILSEYGREVGFSYQLADDLADLEKGERIDSVVIPLLTKLERNSTDNGLVKARMLKKKLERSLPEIKELYTSEIRKHIKKAEALSMLPIIPSNQYKILLQEAPTYIVNMMLREINLTI